MIGAEQRAAAWARCAIKHFGVEREGSWIIALTQADLAEQMGWARNSGTIAAYLAALGPVVTQRRGGIVFDAGRLRQLEERLGESRASTPRTDAVARDLAMRLGRPSPNGTVLVAGPAAKAASLADMAAVLGVHRSTVLGHLRRLQADGRLYRDGGAWIFPPGNGRFPLAGTAHTMAWARTAVEPVADHISLAIGALHDAQSALSDALVGLPSQGARPTAGRQITTDFLAGLDVLRRTVSSLEDLLANPAQGA